GGRGRAARSHSPAERPRRPRRPDERVGPGMAWAGGEAGPLRGPGGGGVPVKGSGRERDESFSGETPGRQTGAARQYPLPEATTMTGARMTFGLLAGLSLLVAGGAQKAAAQQYYQIKNVSSGLVLDLPIPDGQRWAVRIQQFAPNGGKNQQWTFIPVDPRNRYIGSGYWYIVSRDTGMCLEARSDGTRPWLWETFGPRGAATMRQHFWFEERGRDARGNILYRVGNRAFPGQVLDVPGIARGVANPNGGVPIQLFPWNGGGNQLWTLAPVPNY